MANKDSKQFHEEYPGGYQKNGYVYDGKGNCIGYVTGGGDWYCIKETGDYYQMKK